MLRQTGLQGEVEIGAVGIGRSFVGVGDAAAHVDQERKPVDHQQMMAKQQVRLGDLRIGPRLLHPKAGQLEVNRHVIQEVIPPAHRHRLDAPSDESKLWRYAPTTEKLAVPLVKSVIG